jgi:hypothetical protein
MDARGPNQQGRDLPASGGFLTRFESALVGSNCEFGCPRRYFRHVVSNVDEGRCVSGISMHGIILSVHFHAEHQFAWPVDAVMRTTSDPELYIDLQLPDLSQPEVLGQWSEENSSHLQLRYTFVGQIDSIARSLLGKDQLQWLQEVEVDAMARSGRLTFTSEDDAHRLHGEAEIVFRSDDEGTMRLIDGDLVVAVPFLGPAAERKIVPGLLRRLDIEAQAIRKMLEAG